MKSAAAEREGCDVGIWSRIGTNDDETCRQHFAFILAFSFARNDGVPRPQ